MSHSLSSPERAQEGHKEKHYFPEVPTDVSVHHRSSITHLSSGQNGYGQSKENSINSNHSIKWQTEPSSADVVTNGGSLVFSQITDHDKSVGALQSARARGSAKEKSIHQNMPDYEHSRHSFLENGTPFVENSPLLNKFQVPSHQIEEDFEESEGPLLSSSPPSITDPPEESPRPLKFEVSSNLLCRIFTPRIFTPRIFRKKTTGFHTAPRSASTTGVRNSEKPNTRTPNVTIADSCLVGLREADIDQSPSVQASVNDHTIGNPHGLPPDPLPAMGSSSCDEDGSWTPVTSPRAGPMLAEWRGRSVIRTVGSHFSTSSVRSRPRSPRRLTRDGNGRRNRRQVSVSPGPRQRIPHSKSRTRSRRPGPLSLASDTN